MSGIPNQPPSDGRPSNSLHFIVGEMSGKLDQLMLSVAPALATLATRVEVVEGRLAQFVPRSELQQDALRLDARVGALEALRWQALGGAALIGFAAGAYEFLPTLLLTFTKAHP